MFGMSWWMWLVVLGGAWYFFGSSLFPTVTV